MNSRPPTSSRIPGLYRLSIKARREVLQNQLGLGPTDLEAFCPEKGLSLETADVMVENAIGVLALPIGVAANFVVDGEPVLVPMATEEPSVIAACSHIAKLASLAGGFVTEVDEPIMIGQIQVLALRDIDKALEQIAQSHDMLVRLGNSFCPSLVARGGGCLNLEPRLLPRVSGDDLNIGPMLVVHVHIDCRDAMGANIVNTVVEGLAPHIAALTGGQIGFKILSNLADRRLARARCDLPYRALASEPGVDNGAQIARRIVEGYDLARRDPYRACTHNKGIMNGIDALAIATGNDWRAIEAGAHAYACKSGRYSSLSHYALDDEVGRLRCSIELPMSVGVVGGSTRMHPSVAASLKILGPFAKSAQKLAGLMAAVGLAQNLGALRALANEGIQQGHMTLHHKKSEWTLGNL
jgi:hydroxymethylglutaryl-CoA reductase